MVEEAKTLVGEKVLDLGAGRKQAFVSKTTDPLISPQPYSQPADFAAQYPQPLDTTEILTMCEEIGLLQFIPEIPGSLNADTWREMDELYFTSGSNYIAFADGSCPEEYTHDGNNLTVNIKNIGAKKSLSVRDIKHSMAVAAANWNGISMLNGPFDAFSGLPGEGPDMPTIQRETVRDVKEKEVALAMTLVMNGEDDMLVTGDATSNALEFDGIESWASNRSCTMHTNNNSASGSFSSTSFDRFLAEACAPATVIMGHPQSIQEMMAGYFQLGFQGSQVIQTNGPGDRVVPGFNFAGEVNTGIGRLKVVGDRNFTVNDMGNGAFQGDLWALRMSQNGDPLVYRRTQIPLSLNDLVPGCTAISFEVWKATALVIKACCAQSKYTTQFTGRISATCSVVGVPTDTTNYQAYL
jgi:hypothetical protein